MKHLELEQLANLSCAQVVVMGAPTPHDAEKIKKDAAELLTKNYGVDFQPDEFQVSKDQAIAIWRPPAAGYLDAELHGGPCDGSVIPDGYENGHVFTAKYERPVGNGEFEADKTVSPVEYHFSGWNTETKRWIYRSHPTI